MKKNLFFAFIILAMMVACFVVPVAAEDSAVTLSEGRYPFTVNASDVYGQYLNIDRPFNKISVATASWGNNIGSLTFKLYNWKGDYATTIASTPITTRDFVNFRDNTSLSVAAPSGTIWNAGEYLWTFSNAVEEVAVYATPKRNLDSKILEKSFCNGKEFYWTLRSTITYYSGSVTTTAKNKVVIYLNETVEHSQAETPIEVSPVIVRNRTLVPISFIQNLGAVVTIDEDIEAIIISSDTKEIVIREREYQMSVNGSVVELDAYADTIGGVKMVPLRAIAESLGLTVEYHEAGVVIVNYFVSDASTVIPVE